MVTQVTIIRLRMSDFQIQFYGKLGVVRVLISQLGLTRPSFILFSLGIVREIVPLVINEENKKHYGNANLVLPSHGYIMNRDAETTLANWPGPVEF